jgi:hypothetical protein
MAVVHPMHCAACNAPTTCSAAYRHPAYLFSNPSFITSPRGGCMQPRRYPLLPLPMMFCCV